MSQSNDLLASPFEEDEELLTEIGRVVALWGTVHHQLRILTAKRLGTSPDDTDIVLKNFSGEGAKIQFLIGLISARQEIADKEIIECLETLNKLANQRNIIVHGGPIKGGKRGHYDWDYHFVNFRNLKPDARDRVKKAKPYIADHLQNLREAGTVLWDILHGDDVKCLEAFKANH